MSVLETLTWSTDFWWLTWWPLARLGDCFKEYHGIVPQLRVRPCKNRTCRILLPNLFQVFIWGCPQWKVFVAFHTRRKHIFPAVLTVPFPLPTDLPLNNWYLHHSQLEFQRLQHIRYLPFPWQPFVLLLFNLGLVLITQWSPWALLQLLFNCSQKVVFLFSNSFWCWQQSSVSREMGSGGLTNLWARALREKDNEVSIWPHSRLGNDRAAALLVSQILTMCLLLDTSPDRKSFKAYTRTKHYFIGRRKRPRKDFVFCFQAWIK